MRSSFDFLGHRQSRYSGGLVHAERDGMCSRATAPRRTAHVRTVFLPNARLNDADRVRQSRDALLDAGLSALAERTREAVTIDDVSARAGLSKRCFYEKFPTRNDQTAELSHVSPVIHLRNGECERS